MKVGLGQVSGSEVIMEYQSGKGCSSIAVVPNLGPPDVLGLHLPEILASKASGEGFWEL